MCRALSRHLSYPFPINSQYLKTWGLTALPRNHPLFSSIYPFTLRFITPAVHPAFHYHSLLIPTRVLLLPLLLSCRGIEWFQNSRPRLWKTRAFKTQNHPKTTLQDSSQSLPSFRDRAKILQDPLFSRNHSIPLLVISYPFPNSFILSWFIQCHHTSLTSMHCLKLSRLISSRLHGSLVEAEFHICFWFFSPSIWTFSNSKAHSWKKETNSRN